MSRIDELIERLCPDGVEYKQLREIGSVTRGGNFQKKHFVDQGVPCIHYGQIYTRYGLHATETISFVSAETAAKSKMAHHGDVVMAVTSENIEDVCKCVTWLGESDVAISGHTAIIHHNQNPKYMTYFFHSALFDVQKRKLAHGTKVIEVTPDRLLDTKIPVPPIEVQEEVVRILDSFAELEAELEARRRQYAYYRDELLKFTERESISWLKLGDAGVFTRGKRFTASDYVDDGIGSIHYGEIYTGYGISASKTFSHLPEAMRNSLRFAKYGDVVIAATGENVEDLCKSVAWLGEEDVAVHDDCWIYTSDLNPRYVVHALLTANVAAQKKTLVSNGKVSRISGKNLASITIPVPNKEEQDRVVEVLDRFDALVNDIYQGLPAEIEARRKQYAYYRDKLLSFKEKVA